MGGGGIPRIGGERRGGEPNPRKGGGWAPKDGENPKTGGQNTSPPKTNRLLPGIVTPKKQNTEPTLNRPDEKHETIPPGGDATAEPE